MKTILQILLLSSLVTLSGCITYHIAEPLYPKNNNPNKTPRAITTLQPEFTWKPSNDPGVTYDLIIYEGITQDATFWKSAQRKVGNEIYYKENLSGTSHKVQSELKPGTEYYWSIRTRKGEEVSQWGYYNYDLFLVFSYVGVSNAMYRFKTPDK